MTHPIVARVVCAIDGVGSSLKRKEEKGRVDHMVGATLLLYRKYCFLRHFVCSKSRALRCLVP